MLLLELFLVEIRLWDTDREKVEPRILFSLNKFAVILKVQNTTIFRN